MSRLAPLVVAALLAAAPASAQDRAAEIDEIFSFATPATPGCAVGVSRHGKVVVNRAYGLATVERGAPLSASSTFDIGSTQKQFVAAAILLLVEDGRLALSDDIRKHFPELPDYGHAVTVDHLLTHTGGLRDWTGLLPMAEEGAEALTVILRQRGLNFVPGEEWSYSNSGYVLLKEIVTRSSGMSFAEFARTRLFEPLGMTSSAYVPDITHAGPNAALGYQKDGAGWKPFMRLGNNRGGGAIVSSVGDLLIWNDALASEKLGKFVTGKLHERTRLSNGRTLKYARGLIVDHTPGGLVISHSGGAAGFSTWLGRVPEHALSVAVACNFDPVSATALAGRVADLYLPPAPQTAQAPADSDAAAAARIDVNVRAGLFFNERTGEPLRLIVNDGRLQVEGGRPLMTMAGDRFRAARGDLFFMSQDEFELYFPSPDRLELTSMEGLTTRYRRAQPYSPTAADLQALAGRYESDELGSVFEIVPATGGIVMRFERSPERAVDFVPVERDVFQFRRMLVRFQRDAAGTVVGFDYSNPVIRNIRVTRVGDLAAASRPATERPSSEPSSATPAAPSLEALTGFYEAQAGRGITIVVENGKLYGEPTGNPRRELVLQSGTTYTVVGTSSPMTVTFVLGADGRATEMVMRQGDGERRLPRTR